MTKVEQIRGRQRIFIGNIDQLMGGFKGRGGGGFLKVTTPPLLGHPQTSQSLVQSECQEGGGKS